MIDLGYNHYLEFVGWHPDRELNPQYAKIPDIEKCCAIITHNDGKCEGAIHFDLENIRKIFNPEHVWQVISWEPLTLSPSLLCKICNDHGYIREGKWVPV